MIGNKYNFKLVYSMICDGNFVFFVSYDDFSFVVLLDLVMIKSFKVSDFLQLKFNPRPIY